MAAGPGSLALSRTRIAARRGISDFGESVEFDQPTQQSVHLLERDHVGSIGWGFVGILVGFDENTSDADRDRRACQDADKFPFAARGCALPAWLLDGMGGIKNDWGTCTAGEDWQCAHIGDESVVAER